jgi:hypothetical protein
LLVVTFLPVGFCGEKNFIAGVDFGPNILDFGVLPRKIIPRELNQGTGSLLSCWALFGYRFKGIHVISRYSLAGSGDTRPKVGRDPGNVGRIYLVSLVVSHNFIGIRRLNIKGMGGYQYTYFKAFPTNNTKLNYKYIDWGPTICLSTRIIFTYIWGLWLYWLIWLFMDFCKIIVINRCDNIVALLHNLIILLMR